MRSFSKRTGIGRRFIRGDNDDRRSAPMYKLAEGRLPRDQEIKERVVHLRLEDGQLSELVVPNTILAGLDLRVESLVMVAPRNEGDQPYAICQIVDRKKHAEREREQEREKRSRKKAVKSKELEMSWSIDRHDLEYRLKIATAFLKKGHKVEIRLVAKKGKRVASRSEAAALLASIKGLINEVPGSRESRTGEGELLGTMKIYLDGPPGGLAAEKSPSKDTTPPPSQEESTTDATLQADGGAAL